ncbi:MAG: hypothetical protein ABIJ40_16425 [Bacteroidota bacterium]|nr:hypothetical protein [bacterium]MBU1872427.1 hypothetical protein [bacterium]
MRQIIIEHIFIITLIFISNCNHKYESTDQIIIAFNNSKDVFIYDTFDQSLINITENLVDTLYWAEVSAFSDNGEELLFTLDYMKLENEWMLSNRDDIYLYNVISGESRRITNNEYREINPKFSNDGEKIIYQSFENGNSDIFLINKDGSNKKLIVDNTGYEWYPTFSADGQNIFYLSIRAGKTDIYMNTIDGKNEDNITNDQMEEGAPAISKDGNFIVYNVIESTINVGDFDKGMRKLDLNTRLVTQITAGNNGVSGFDMCKISVDLKYIACRYFDASWLYIYLMDIDGNNQIELGKGIDVEFTQDGKFVIYQSNDGLHKYNIAEGTDELILNQDISGFNIEVSTNQY